MTESTTSASGREVPTIATPASSPRSSRSATPIPFGSRCALSRRASSVVLLGRGVRPTDERRSVVEALDALTGEVVGDALRRRAYVLVHLHVLADGVVGDLEREAVVVVFDLDVSPLDCVPAAKEASTERPTDAEQPASVLHDDDVAVRDDGAADERLRDCGARSLAGSECVRCPERSRTYVLTERLPEVSARAGWLGSSLRRTANRRTAPAGHARRRQR
jgi:hypothetical protein